MGFNKPYLSTVLLRKTEEHFSVNNIECILVYGNVSRLNKKEKEAFERYRNELRSIRIIGFDELLARVDNLLKLLEGRPDVLTRESEDPDETLPF